MSLKLCIAGSFGYADIGDEAMLTAHLDFLQEELGIGPDQIYLFGDQPEYLSKYHGHPLHNCLSSRKLVAQSCVSRGDYASLIRWFPRLRPYYSVGIRRLIRESSGLLVTGGGTINTRDEKGDSIRRLHAIISYFRDASKPIFLSGQTIGPLGLHRSHDCMAKEIVDAASRLTVRDSHYSRRYLAGIDGMREDLVETVDDAFALPYKHLNLPSDVAEFVSTGEVVAVNVTEYTSETARQRAFMAEVCETLIQRYNKKVVLVAHTPLDFFRLGMIRDMIQNNSKDSVLLPDTRAWCAGELKLLISKCLFAVGGRYHFIVFCATTGIPFLGMCGNHYSYIKQDGMARPLGLEDSILTEKETFDRGVFYSRLDELTQARPSPLQELPLPLPSFLALKEWIDEIHPEG